MLQYESMKYVIIALALFVALAILNAYLGGTPL